jgi:hypothetical protein
MGHPVCQERRREPPRSAATTGAPARWIVTAIAFEIVAMAGLFPGFAKLFTQYRGVDPSRGLSAKGSVICPWWESACSRVLA